MVTSNTECSGPPSPECRLSARDLDGISASDRAATIKALVDPQYPPFRTSTRPGHIFPLRYRPAGCSSGQATPRPPSIWPVPRECRRPGFCARWSARTRREWPPPRVDRVRQKHGLHLVSIARSDPLPQAQGQTCASYRRCQDPPPTTGFHRVRLRIGARRRTSCSPWSKERSTRQARHLGSRVHSECLTGDVFGSARECRTVDPSSMRAMAAISGARNRRDRLT